MSRKLGVAVVGLGMAAKPHALALQTLSDRIEVCGAFAQRGGAANLLRDLWISRRR